MNVVFADQHYFGPHALGGDLTKEWTQNTILLGDIVDLANCRVKDIPAAITLCRRLYGIYGEKYIMGNHERNILGLDNNKFYIENGVYFTHGHYELWGYYRAFNNERGNVGSGFLKRSFVYVADKLRNFVPFFLTGDKEKRILEVLQAYGCHTYICGHAHVRKKVERQIGNKKIIIVPRGKTEI